MAITAFDTHKVAQILSGAGFTEEQVNAQVGVLTQVTSELVTKADLKTELKDVVIKLGLLQFTFAVFMLTVIEFIIM